MTESNHNEELLRRQRLLNQNQNGSIIGLLVIGMLIAALFAWGNSLTGDTVSENLQFGDAPGPPGLAGETLYNQYCFGCHGLTGDGNEAADIPALNQNGEAWKKPRVELENHILDGGETMPELSGLVSADDASLLIDFIQIWWTQEQVDTFNNNN